MKRLTEAQRALRITLLPLLVLLPGVSAGQSYGAANDAARRAAEQAAADRARAAATQLELDRQRQQREQAESQRRLSSPSFPGSSTPNSSDGRSSERGPTTSGPTSRAPTEQEQRDLERARAFDRARAKREDDFKAFIMNCQAANRLGQPECWAASEDIRANAATLDLRNRMGTRRWEDYRFYRKIPPEFAQDVARVEELSTWAEKAREHWNAGTQPDPQLVRSRLEINRVASELDQRQRDAEKDIRTRGQPSWQPASLVREERTSSPDVRRCSYVSNGRSFDADLRVGRCPASIKYDGQRNLIEFAS